MKLYSKNELALGIASIVLGLAYCTRGNILNVLFGISFAGIGAVHLYRAFDRNWNEKSHADNEATKTAARERFGKWAVPVRYAGLFLVLIGLGACILSNQTVGGLLLLLAGMGYTLIMESCLKKLAEL